MKKYPLIWLLAAVIVGVIAAFFVVIPTAHVPAMRGTAPSAMERLPNTQPAGAKPEGEVSGSTPGSVAGAGIEVVPGADATGKPAR